MHPYFAGVTVGYIMFQVKDKILQKKWFISFSYWTVAFIIFLLSLFITAFKDASNLKFALTLSLGRYLLGLFIGSAIFMLHFGYGGIINKILSSRLFVHTNKTIYVVYLIEPVFVLFFNSNQETSPHFDVASTVRERLLIICSLNI